MKYDNQNRAFIEKCRNIDFSSESVNMEKNIEDLKVKLKNIKKEDEKIMNKKFKKPTAIIVVAATLLCLSMAVYGNDLIKVIKSVTLGDYATYSVVEVNNDDVVVPIPEDMKGQVFDKDGNELKTLAGGAPFYNKDGEEITTFESENIFVTTNNETKEAANMLKCGLEEGKSYFICDTLSLEYLPKGYKFDRTAFYFDPVDGNTLEKSSQKYMHVYYSDGEYEMYSQIRYMDEETAFELSAGSDIQKTTINGYETVISGNMLSIQINNVLYTFFATDNVTTDDLVNMAESLK